MQFAIGCEVAFVRKVGDETMLQLRLDMIINGQRCIIQRKEKEIEEGIAKEGSARSEE
jgi:hypothetical protein